MRSGDVKSRVCKRTSGAYAQQGFAYLLLLITVAILGLLSASSLSIGAQVSRRDAERELIAIGNEFEQALKSYAGISGNLQAATAGATGPGTLEDLLKDPRFPSVKRHLRQIYVDPLTGRVEWGVVRTPSGSIVGIYSLADGVPIQRSGFDATRSAFENANSYGAWIFGFADANFPGNRRGEIASPSTNKLSD